MANIDRFAVNSATIMATEGEVVDLRLASHPSYKVFTATSIEATGVNMLKWSTDGINFYDYEEFTDVLRPIISELYNARFLRVDGAATDVRISVILL